MSFFAKAAILLLLLVIPLASHSDTGLPADSILGRWYYPARQSSIEVYRMGNHYNARITEIGPQWQKGNGSLKGQVILSDLTFKGNEWSDGELIHPETGLHFNAALTLKDAQTLMVTVYKGMRCFRKEFTLVRQTGTNAGEPALIFSAATKRQTP